MKPSKSIQDELSVFSWKDVNQLIKEGEFASTKKLLGKDTYIFIAKPKNFSTVVELAYTSLQKTDSENVTIEHAIKVAEEMQKFAQRIVAQMNKEKTKEE